MRQAIHNLEASKIREVANAGLGRSDVLAFWFGESDEVTPEVIRQAAIDSLQRGETFYAHNLGPARAARSRRAYMSGLHPQDRGLAHRDHLRRRQRPDAGGAGAGRCRRRSGGDHARVAQPDGAAGDPRRAGALRAAGAEGRAVDARSRCAARRGHARHQAAHRQRAQQPDRLDAHARRAAGDPRPLPPNRHLDPRRRGVRAALLRRRRRTAARPASSTSRCPTTGWSSPTASPRASS